MKSPDALKEGQLIRAGRLADAARTARQAAEISSEEAAEQLNVPDTAIKYAEAVPSKSMFRLRKRMLEVFSGYTLEGPFYRIRRLDS